MRRASLLLLVGLASLLLACAPTVPTGSLFTRLAPPDPDDTLVYVYRQDSLRGVDGVDIELDGENLGRLLNGEYLAFLIDPGRHEIRARLKWLQTIPRSWNSLDFMSRPGQTLYVRVWAAYQHEPGPMPGRTTLAPSNEKAKVGLFLGLQKPELAKQELESTRRNPGH